jgi:aminoglycoside/choline kinase family phosphotransferase
MADRAHLLEAFLASAGWGEARMAVLAGDASNRRYLRLSAPRTGAAAVLMDAPPDRGEDVTPFIRIAEHLAALGLSAPRILARDTEAGLLLLEDLGDDLFARVLTRAPDLENRLYSAATDLLVALHTHDPPAGLAPYDTPLMTDLAALAHDWYRRGATGRADPAARAAFREVLAPILADIAKADVPGRRGSGFWISRMPWRATAPMISSRCCRTRAVTWHRAWRTR